MGSFKDVMAWAEREAMLEPGDSEVDQGTVEGPRVVRLGDVAPEPVHWLWEGYVARGKVNLVAGDPGLWKSWATLDVAARVTVGGETPDRQHIMEQPWCCLPPKTAWRTPCGPASTRRVGMRKWCMSWRGSSMRTATIGYPHWWTIYTI